MNDYLAEFETITHKIVGLAHQFMFSLDSNLFLWLYLYLFN